VKLLFGLTKPHKVLKSPESKAALTAVCIVSKASISDGLAARVEKLASVLLIAVSSAALTAAT
jgi:hypothetical protein